MVFGADEDSPLKTIHSAGRIAAVLAATLWLVSACSRDGSTDANIETFGQLSLRLIAAEMTDQIGLGPLVVSCDARAEEALEPDDSFSCVGSTTDGRQIDFTSTVDPEGTGLDLVTDNVVLGTDMAEVEQTAVTALAKSLGEGIGNENFSCGDTTVVLEPGEAIPCVLTDPTNGLEYDSTVIVTNFDDLEIDVVLDSEPRN